MTLCVAPASFGGVDLSSALQLLDRGFVSMLFSVTPCTTGSGEEVDGGNTSSQIDARGSDPSAETFFGDDFVDRFCGLSQACVCTNDDDNKNPTLSDDSILD